MWDLGHPLASLGARDSTASILPTSLCHISECCQLIQVQENRVGQAVHQSEVPCNARTLALLSQCLAVQTRLYDNGQCYPCRRRLAARLFCHLQSQLGGTMKDSRQTPQLDNAVGQSIQRQTVQKSSLCTAALLTCQRHHIHQLLWHLHTALHL